MKSLASILRGHALAAPIVRGVTAAQAVETANEILEALFGPSIKEFATAAYLKNGILSIACLSSTVAQEIKLQEQIIIDKINQRVGPQTVLRFKYLS